MACHAAHACSTRLAVLTSAACSVQNNLLKLKIELLVEMLTVANLDSDKLEDLKEAADNERDAAVNEQKRLVAEKIGPTS